MELYIFRKQLGLQLASKDRTIVCGGYMINVIIFQSTIKDLCVSN